jgi:hypothetical protein
MAGLDALSGDGGSPVETGILVVAFACIGRGIYRLARAVTDTLGVRTLTGEVLWIAPWKTRTKDDEAITYLYYLAVDDGTSDRTTAWALPQDLRSKHPYQVGRSVELTVRPWSRRVTAARAVPGSGSGPAAAPAAVPAPVPAPAPAPVPAPMPQQVPVAPQVSGSQAASAGFPFQALPVEVLPVEVLPVQALSVPALPVPAIPVDPVVASVPVAAAVPAVPVTAAVPAAAVAAVATAATVPELLTADELSAWFGVPVQPGQSLPVGPSTSAWSFRCEPPGSAGPGSPGPGSPGAPADVVLVSAGRGTADTMALDRARHGTPVPGVGEEAYLVEQGAVARWGSVVVQVRTPPHLGVGPDALVSALQAAVVRVAKQRVG